METGILQWLGAWTWVRLPIGGQELDGFETPANKGVTWPPYPFTQMGTREGKERNET